MLDFLGGNLREAIPLITFILGALSVYFFTSNKKDLTKQTLNEYSKELLRAHNEIHKEFVAVLQSFTAKMDDPTSVATFQDFIAISCVAEKYFYQQKLIGSAILAGKVDPETRDNFFVPSIVDSITRTLPRVYKTLHSIASANGFMYDVELKDENYQELYLVVAKYGATAAATDPAEKSSVA